SPPPRSGEGVGGWGLLTLLLALAAPLRAADEDRKDEEAVRAAGVKVDGPGLLGFLRARTLDEEDRKDIEEQIRKLSSRVFTVREQAFEALKKRGTPAIPFLREALNSRDLEVARRAERCLAEIDRGPGSELTLAVLRLLSRKAPAGSVAALLGFAPFAEDENVEETVLET